MPSTIRLNVAQIPPGGWHYPQAIEHSDPVRLTASRPYDLIQVIRQFRIDNGILPLGNPEADLIDYYIQNYPTHVLGLKKDGRPEKAHRVGNTLRLLDRVAQWAHRITGMQGLQYVYQDEANQRAQICLGCPKNRNWRTCSACSDLTGTTDRRINVLLGSRARFPGLLGCQSCSHDNTLAVWLKNGLTRGTDAPDNCWVEK